MKVNKAYKFRIYPIKIINTIEQTPSKSFNNVVKALGGELA